MTCMIMMTVMMMMRMMMYKWENNAVQEFEIVFIDDDLSLSSPVLLGP